MTLNKKGVYLTGLTDTPMDKLCFLTFHKFANNYDAKAAGYDSHVGAIPDLAEQDEKKRRWSKLDPAWIAKNKASFKHYALWEFPDDGKTPIAYLDVFCDGVFSALTGFTHEKRLEFCSGSPSTASCAAIALKALKRGFEAIGLKAEKPNLLQKMFSGDAVLADLKSLCEDALKGAKLDGNVTQGFEAVSVSEKAGPWEPKPKDGTFKWPGYSGGYMNGAEEFWASWWLPVNPKEPPKPNADTDGVKAIAATQKSKLLDPSKGMVWANIYGFRGDSRAPILIKAAGGMFANATRDDKKADVDARHAGTAGTAVLDHVAHQLKGALNTDSSGFVSASSSRDASEEFIHRDLKGDGYMYLVRIRSGVVVNKTWAAPPSPQECEVSVPGAIAWEDVVGWRRIEKDTYTGPLFLTKDPKALASDKKEELKKVMAYKKR